MKAEALKLFTQALDLRLEGWNIVQAALARFHRGGEGPKIWDNLKGIGNLVESLVDLGMGGFGSGAMRGGGRIAGIQEVAAHVFGVANGRRGVAALVIAGESAPLAMAAPASRRRRGGLGGVGRGGG